MDHPPDTIVLDGFVAVSTNTGDNLCIGFNPDSTGGFMAAPYCETGEFYVQGIDQELRGRRQERAHTLSWASGHLTELPALSLHKLQITYTDDRDGLRALESFGEDEFLTDRTRQLIGALTDVYFFTVLAAGSVGFVLVASDGWRRRREDPVPALVVLLTLGAVAVPVVSFADAAAQGSRGTVAGSARRIGAVARLVSAAAPPGFPALPTMQFHHGRRG